MRTGRSELHPRVLQLLNFRFDEEDGTLFLGEHYTHHPNTTAEYLLPAKIHSLHINNIPFTSRRPGVMCMSSALVCTTCTHGIQEKGAFGLVALHTAEILGFIICFATHFLCVTFE